MASYNGGTKVSGGYYWNPRKWAVEVVGNEGGKLPGTAEAKYVKIPFPLLFVIVPVLGALFLVFLPLIGFGLFAYAIVRRLRGGVAKTAEELAATVAPGWAAGEAHLTGKAPEAGGAVERASPAIEKLAKEIEAARKNEPKP
jgi:hypothetical protein